MAWSRTRAIVAVGAVFMLPSVATTPAGWAPRTLAQATPPAAIAPYLPGTDPAGLSGGVVADGSSTVWPITDEVAVRFRDVAEDVQVEVEVSGTGGGFRRFCAGDSDLQNASRPIADDEIAECSENGVAYHAFEIAYDGVTVVVDSDNDFVNCLTVEQLRRLWTPDDPATTWRELDPAWPDREIELYGPGPDSGTFDYFTAEVVGEAGATRTDYSPSENDFVLVEGVANDDDALGYFGFAYYAETRDRLKAVAVDGGGGCVVPSWETIADGTYRPLSRPLYLYVNRSSLARPAVREFVRFYLASAKEAAVTVGYVATQDGTYAANQAEIEGAVADTVPPDGPTAGGTPTP